MYKYDTSKQSTPSSPKREKNLRRGILNNDKKNNRKELPSSRVPMEPSSSTAGRESLNPMVQFGSSVYEDLAEGRASPRLDKKAHLLGDLGSSDATQKKNDQIGIDSFSIPFRKKESIKTLQDITDRKYFVEKNIIKNANVIPEINLLKGYLKDIKLSQDKILDDWLFIHQIDKKDFESLPENQKRNIEDIKKNNVESAKLLIKTHQDLIYFCEQYPNFGSIQEIESKLLSTIEMFINFFQDTDIFNTPNTRASTSGTTPKIRT